jgi:hypothetical protein
MEYRLWVFQNRVLRKIFRPKRDQVTGLWRKVHNEGLHKLCISPSITEMASHDDVTGRAHSTYGGEEECIHGTSRKVRRKDTTGRPKYRWVDNIKMDLR